MKTLFDQKVPKDLKQTQQWFGSIVSRPVDVDNAMNPISPSGRPMEEEACEYIASSTTLSPAQRIELYNRQYWWRLLAVLHENFPLVTRLFGYFDFNQRIAIPYLVKYPPNHWSLNYLGDRMVDWVNDEYQSNDKQLVYNAARIDSAYLQSFLTVQNPIIDLASLPTPGDISSLSNAVLWLQPHVHLFELPYDLFAFRHKFLTQDPDYWVEQDFPELVHYPDSKPGHFILYRDRKNNVVVESISGSASQVLQRFQEGTSIDALCEWFEKQPEQSELYCEASQHLGTWLQRWVMLLSEKR